MRLLSRTAIAVVVGVAVLGATTLMLLSTPAIEPALQAANATTSTAPQPPEQAVGPVTPAPQRSAPWLTITAVEAGSDRPLSTAHAAWLSTTGPADTVLPEDGKDAMAADASGRILLRPPSDIGSVLLLRAPQHVPRIVEPMQDGAIVPLEAAAWVEVSVIDGTGQPVEGAWTGLTHRPLGDFNRLLPLGIGHPLSGQPAWRAETDGRGIAHHDELPPGPFYLTALAPGMAPSGEAGANSLVELRPGPNRCHVSVEDAYAAVFQCPSPSRVASVTWNIDHRRLDLSTRVTASIGLLRDRLLDRFPGSIPYVHVPRASQIEPVPVQCFARLEDGTLWQGAWELQPIRAIDSPVFLQLADGAVRPVTIRLLTPNGRQFDGIPLTLRNRNEGFSIRTETGVQALVPHGTYKVNANQADPAVYLAFQDFVITVDDQAPDAFVATTSDPVCDLVVRVTYPSATVLGVISLSLSNEEGQGANVVNYKPERGEIRRLVSGETVTIQVTSPYYEDVVVGPTRLDPDKPTVLEVVLAEKAARSR